MNPQFFLVFGHYTPPVAAGTAAVICGIILGIVTPHSAFQIQRRFSKLRLRFPGTVAVRSIGRSCAVVAIGAHSAITMIIIDLAFSLVHRNLVVVNAQTITLRIAVSKNSALQETVRGETNTGYHMGRIKSCLFYFGKIVFRVAVQFQHTYLDEREFFVTPDFGNIKRILIMMLSLLFGHYLNVHSPLGIITALNSFI